MKVREIKTEPQPPAPPVLGCRPAKTFLGQRATAIAGSRRRNPVRESAARQLRFAPVGVVVITHQLAALVVVGVGSLDHNQ